MNCDGVRDLLSAYIDGELSAGELLRVEQHLRRCHCCADDVDSLRQTIALVASLEEVEVPASFHVQLHERLVALGPPVAASARRASHRPASRHGKPRWAMPAAAAAAVAALAIGVTTYTGGIPDGVIVNRPFQAEKFAVKTPDPDPPVVAVVPTESVVDEPVTTKPINPEITPPDKPIVNDPDPAPPGKLPNNGGVKSAEHGNPNGTTEVLKPRLEVTHEFVVARDDARLAQLKQLFSVVIEEPGKITVPVSATDADAQLIRVKGMWPQVQPTTIEKDLAQQIKDAEDSISNLASEIKQYESLPVSEQEGKEQRLKNYKERMSILEDELTLLNRRVEKVLIVFKFQNP